MAYSKPHFCPDFDYGLVTPDDPMMEFCLCDPVKKCTCGAEAQSNTDLCEECYLKQYGRRWVKSANQQ